MDQFDVSTQLKEFQNEIVNNHDGCDNMAIELENVYCKYQKNFKTVLNNVNIKIKKNQKVLS